MKKFRPFLIMLSLSFLLLAFTHARQGEKKLMGHWATKNYMGYYDGQDASLIGDTITFYKMKFNWSLYHWRGGYNSGVEFKPDSQFVQYKNVECSDETDIKIGHDEKYFFRGDSVVEVKSDIRNFRFKILYVDSKKLSIKILGDK